MCDEIHREFDGFANGSVQIGELPPWTHVRGRMAFYVYQGPYNGLGDAWQDFARKKGALDLEFHGPPGEVYVCDPSDHPGDAQKTMLTILWAPLKG